MSSFFYFFVKFNALYQFNWLKHNKISLWLHTLIKWTQLNFDFVWLVCLRSLRWWTQIWILLLTTNEKIRFVSFVNTLFTRFFFLIYKMNTTAGIFDSSIRWVITHIHTKNKLNKIQSSMLDPMRKWIWFVIFCCCVALYSIEFQMNHMVNCSVEYLQVVVSTIFSAFIFFSSVQQL